MIDLNKKIGKYLTLKECCKSQKAIKLGIDNTPSEEDLKHIEYFVKNIYDPLCDHFKTKIPFTNFFRNKRVNKAVGGSATSEHTLGCAGDFDCDGLLNITNADIFMFIRDNLPYTELIWEHEGQWVHCSCNFLRPNEKELLKTITVIENGKSKVKYIKTIYK